jgi:hypothetical protein
MANCRQQIRSFIDLACTFESGRINSLAFVTEEKAVIADATPSLWSDPSFWTSETYNGDIVIHDKVSGSYSASDNTAPGKGTQLERNIGKVHTITTRIESVKSNSLYWDDINISDNYRIVWVGDFYQVLFVGTTNARISANIIQEDDLGTIMEWEVIGVWSDIRLPRSYDVPSGIFN